MMSGDVQRLINFCLRRLDEIRLKRVIKIDFVSIVGPSLFLFASGFLFDVSVERRALERFEDRSAQRRRLAAGDTGRRQRHPVTRVQRSRRASVMDHRCERHRTHDFFMEF